MSDFDGGEKQVQRAPSTSAATSGGGGGSPESAMHETRMNVTRHRRAAMRKGEGKGGAPQVDIPEGGGQQLPGGVQKSMEKKLGADLSGVKVHTGGDSAGASEKLNARAFTVGSDVHFNAGQFDPGSKEGTKLLAHELTHVVQGQKGGVQKKEEEGGEADAEGKDGEALEVSDPEEPAEQEADAVADQATADMPEGGAEEDGKAAGGDAAEGAEAKGGEAESEAAPAETEEAAPEAGAKLQSPISAKYSASALRKILRKKAFRDPAAEEAPAPEAEAAGAEAEEPQAAAAADAGAEAPATEGAGAESAEAEAPEAEAEEAPESQSVAAKLKGVHRKIFRDGTSMQLPKAATPTPAEKAALVADEKAKYDEFQGRVATAFSTGLMDGVLDPAAKAKEVWDKIKSKLVSQADVDAMSKDGRVQMNSKLYQDAIAQITPIAAELGKLSSTQFVGAKSFGFWSTGEGEELGRSMSDLTLETSGIGAVFDNIPTLNGKGGGTSWDPELWGGLSQAYAKAVGNEIKKGGKKINVCVGAGADRGNNIWVAVESTAVESTIKEAGMSLKDVTTYYAAAATSRKRDQRKLDKTKGNNGNLGAFPTRDAAIDAADAHFATLPPA